MMLSMVNKIWCGVKTLVYTCYVGAGIAAGYCFVKALSQLINMSEKLLTAFEKLVNSFTI